MKLIDKDALVAEIDRLENKLYYEPENFKDVGAKMALDSLKSFLGTLKVKELQEESVSDDLEKVVEEIVDPTVLNAYGVKEIANRLRRTMIDSVSDDLGEYINKLSKQFPEVSFAKLSRIAVRVAKWKEQQLMANAVEGVVHHFEKCKVASVHYNDPTGVPMAYFTSPEGLSAGDKVKINVIKED